jgi:starch synthase
LNIVYLTTEAVPFAKTGGLADVCGTLPKVVAAQGHRCAVIMPAFSSIERSAQPIETTDISFAVPMSDQKLIGCRLLKSHLPKDPHDPADSADVPVYFIDQPQYFRRPSLYGDANGDYHDNAERFIFYCRAAIIAMSRLGYPVDLVHCNDWQSALVPALMRAASDNASKTQTIATMLSIHNMAYQGNFGFDAFPWTGLGWEHFRPESFEYYNQLNFLKTGVVTSDVISTVSPTYALEIQTPEYGCGLDSILRGIPQPVEGIINGIDTNIWNPDTDPHLNRNYTVADWADAKIDNKLALQAEVGLPQNAELPLLGLIGRLADQKGWDLILPVLREHLAEARPTQWVVLGSGDPKIEKQLRELTEQHPEQLAAYIGFSDALAHRIEASSDMFIMPSHYEPCGLNQLYSLRYGTPCVVTKTGGLADTIVDATPENVAANLATGFHLNDSSAGALDHAINRALQLRYHSPEKWKNLVEFGMSQDWTWRKSADQYIQLYARTISLNRRRRSNP